MALLWATRHGIALPTDDPADAQRALEIALDAMPWNLRIGTYGWSQTRRNWCTATGHQDPRAHLRPEKRRDVWTHWLARQSCARGDVLSRAQSAALIAALPPEAEPYLPLLAPYRRAWRWAVSPGVVRTPGYALVLQRARSGGWLVDVIKTMHWKPATRRPYEPDRRRSDSRRDAGRRRAARAALSAGTKSGTIRANTVHAAAANPRTCPVSGDDGGRRAAAHKVSSGNDLSSSHGERVPEAGPAR